MDRTFYPFVEEGSPSGQDGERSLAVRHCARIAVYDDPAAAPRVVMVEPNDIRSYLEEITATVTRLASEQGGSIPFTVIRECVENLIHAYFIEPTISILEHGNLIRFSDQGPGIREKERALEYGTSSATDEMKRYIRGVGSGLPYAQQWLADKGGTLTVEDNMGRGTVVTISLVQDATVNDTDAASPTGAEYGQDPSSASGSPLPMVGAQAQPYPPGTVAGQGGSFPQEMSPSPYLAGQGWQQSATLPQGTGSWPWAPSGGQLPTGGAVGWPQQAPQQAWQQQAVPYPSPAWPSQSQAAGAWPGQASPQQSYASPQAMQGSFSQPGYPLQTAAPQSLVEGGSVQASPQQPDQSTISPQGWAFGTLAQPGATAGWPSSAQADATDHAVFPSSGMTSQSWAMPSPGAGSRGQSLPSLDAREQQALAYVVSHSSVGPRDLVRALPDASESTWSRVLAGLEDKGLLAKHGQKRQLTDQGRQVLGLV